MVKGVTAMTMESFSESLRPTPAASVCWEEREASDEDEDTEDDMPSNSGGGDPDDDPAKGNTEEYEP